MSSSPKIVIRTEKVLDAYVHLGLKYYLDADGFLWHPLLKKIVGGIDRREGGDKVYLFSDFLPYSQARGYFYE